MRKLILGLALAISTCGVTATAFAQQPEDKVVAQQIASVLKESGQLSNYRVGVKYQDGVAWLLGSVTSQEQHNKAVELAKSAAGVEHVISKLTIKAAAEKTAVQQVQLQQVQPQQRVARRPAVRRSNMPVAIGARQRRQVQQASLQQAQHCGVQGGMQQGGGGAYVPQGQPGGIRGSAQMPGYAWPSYASRGNYAALTYPKQYSASAWPYIGPFYPYPQVPLGWRKVTLEWDDGWWFLDFSDSVR